MTESFEFEEDVETRVISVEVPAHVTADDVKRALEVLASQTDGEMDGPRREFDRGHGA